MKPLAPARTCYVALLRGINVGGNNLIRMSALKACFVDYGFTDATTYIQSGNVVFTASERSADKLARGIEEMLSAGFGYAASVVLRSEKQMREVVGKAPDGFGASPSEYRYDVIFLKEPLTADEAMKKVLTKEGVDRAHGGRGVLYFSRLVSRAPESRLSRLASNPIYKSVTIRNWNTTTKLLEMMEGYA